MAIKDLTSAWNSKVQVLRAAQAVAQPAQPIDQTTLIVAEAKRIRNLNTTAANLDTNTELAREWAVIT